MPPFLTNISPRLFITGLCLARPNTAETSFTGQGPGNRTLLATFQGWRMSQPRRPCIYFVEKLNSISSTARGIQTLPSVLLYTTMNMDFSSKLAHMLTDNGVLS